MKRFKIGYTSMIVNTIIVMLIGVAIFILILLGNSIANSSEDEYTTNIQEREQLIELTNELTSFKALTSDELITINNKTIYIDKDSLSYNELYYCSQLAKIEYKVIIVR